MQMNKNGVARNVAYTLLNNPVKMFVKTPVFILRDQERLERGSVNPKMLVKANFTVFKTAM